MALQQQYRIHSVVSSHSIQLFHRISPFPVNAETNGACLNHSEQQYSESITAEGQTKLMTER